jgi:hypothetical protein
MGGNELRSSNCNYGFNEQRKNIFQHRDICWCNSYCGSIFRAAAVLNVSLESLRNQSQPSVTTTGDPWDLHRMQCFEKSYDKHVQRHTHEVCDNSNEHRHGRNRTRKPAKQKVENKVAEANEGENRPNNQLQIYKRCKQGLEARAGTKRTKRTKRTHKRTSCIVCMFPCQARVASSCLARPTHQEANTCMRQGTPMEPYGTYTEPVVLVPMHVG